MVSGNEGNKRRGNNYEMEKQWSMYTNEKVEKEKKIRMNTSNR